MRSLTADRDIDQPLYSKKSRGQNKAKCGEAQYYGGMETLLEQLKAKNTFLTVPETAALIRAHAVTVRDWIRAGTLPAIRIGNKWVVDPGELASWMAERRSALQ
jgi:excisionase family DNA binding protein